MLTYKYHFHMCAEKLISNIVFQLIFVVYKHDNLNHNAMFSIQCRILLVTCKISNIRSNVIVQNKDLNNFINYFSLSNVYQFIFLELFVFNKMTQDMIPNILNLQK